MSNIISFHKSEVKLQVENAADLTKKILLSAIQLSASDIHFFPSSAQTDIYLRVNSKRIHYRTITQHRYQLLLSYFKFTSGMDIGETRRPQDGAIHLKLDEKQYSLRLSTLPLDQQESLAIRLLPQKESPSLNELFLFPNQLNQLNKWLRHRSGIILLTGPTGSGKTTTMYALLQSLLKNSSFQAITLEDPIEKEMKDLLQVQINEKAGITYDVGLKAALRHDPDLLMVGEIRDRETAKFAFHAGFTGHLLMSTLHAKDAFGTIHRLREMGISKTDLHQSLLAIVSLELIPIKREGNLADRALILEILEGNLLNEAIEGKPPQLSPDFISFDRLRRKAFAYGFIDKENYTSAFLQIPGSGS